MDLDLSSGFSCWLYEKEHATRIAPMCQKSSTLHSMSEQSILTGVVRDVRTGGQQVLELNFNFSIVLCSCD